MAYRRGVCGALCRSTNGCVAPAQTDVLPSQPACLCDDAASRNPDAAGERFDHSVLKGGVPTWTKHLQCFDAESSHDYQAKRQHPVAVVAETKQQTNNKERSDSFWLWAKA